VEAKALVCDEQQTFTYADVVLPDTGPEEVLVRALYSGVSIGTEFALIRGKLSWGPYPICTGYQAVGIVEEVGAGVERFKPGDKVYYRGNRRIALLDGQKVSGVSGAHCSHALVDVRSAQSPEHMPEGVADDVGSLFVMPAVGLLGVDKANVRMGDTIVVYGVGLIGLGNVAFCSQRGAVVIAIDLDRRRLEIARKLGADYLIDASTADAAQEVERIVPGGADVVFEATGIPACIDTAFKLCRSFGKFVYQGNYGAAPISFHFLVPHLKQLTTFFPCGDGQEPCRRAVLKNMALGVLQWEHTLTHWIEAQDSADFYTAINQGEAQDVVGAVIHWSS
jgi:2-desacetyl-2-hydroxyethyl bacteriochlorophyllide A dehydrogenase